MPDALADVCYPVEDRTWDKPAAMSQFDPERTKTVSKSRSAASP